MMVFWSHPDKRAEGSARSLAVLLAAAISVGACAGPASDAAAPTQLSPVATTSAAPSGSPGAVLLYWASYEFHTEPRFQLIFEGGTPASAPDEVRISDRSGAVRASARTKAAASEALRLCARGTNYGSVRATLAVAEDLFKEFIRDESRFVVEARLGGDWTRTSLSNLCHATQ